MVILTGNGFALATTALVQFQEASAARKCAEEMRGIEPPSGDPKKRVRTITVQTSDREFDVARMTGQLEFQSPQGPRIPESGNEHIY